MTTTLPRTCSCGRPARTDNDSGVCHQWPICGLDEVIPRARAEAGRRWGWPSTVKPNSEMSPSDWLDEGMASGFVVGALWAVDPAEGDGSADQ